MENESQAHSELIINSFRGKYDFLSNFYTCDISFNNTIYPSAEHAYQAQKSSDALWKKKCTEPENIRQIKRAAVMLKNTASYINLTPTDKLILMEKIVYQKFSQNYELRNKLIETGNIPLVEGNTWGDEFWGVNSSTGKGENHLGKILMKVRSMLLHKLMNEAIQTGSTFFKQLDKCLPKSAQFIAIQQATIEYLMSLNNTHEIVNVSIGFIEQLRLLNARGMHIDRQPVDFNDMEPVVITNGKDIVIFSDGIEKLQVNIADINSKIQQIKESQNNRKPAETSASIAAKEKIFQKVKQNADADESTQLLNLAAFNLKDMSSC